MKNNGGKRQRSEIGGKGLGNLGFGGDTKDALRLRTDFLIESNPEAIRRNGREAT